MQAGEMWCAACRRGIRLMADVAEAGWVMPVCPKLASLVLQVAARPMLLCPQNGRAACEPPRVTALYKMSMPA